MPKTKISEYNSNQALNTDINSINIDEGCAPSGINDAIRTLMAQLKNFQDGTSGDDITNTGILLPTKLRSGARTDYTIAGASTTNHILNGTSVVGGLTEVMWEASANGADLRLLKSRGASIGTNGIVQSGDALGQIRFAGDDGAAFDEAAKVMVKVDGNPSTTSMPGRIETYTTGSLSTTPTLRTTVDSKGNLVLNSGAIIERREAVAASDVDLSKGNYFTKTISGNTTFTISNVPTSGSVASFIFELTNAASATITWWTTLKWAGGIAPSLTVSGRDVIGFYTHDGGTTWNALLLAKDIK
jgi:hypothetical protein